MFFICTEYERPSHHFIKFAFSIVHLQEEQLTTHRCTYAGVWDSTELQDVMVISVPKDPLLLHLLLPAHSISVFPLFNISYESTLDQTVKWNSSSLPYLLSCLYPWCWTPVRVSHAWERALLLLLLKTTPMTGCNSPWYHDVKVLSPLSSSKFIFCLRTAGPSY
jgi:hypothetical protein